MKDEEKTKKQLIQELAEMRRRNSELEALEAERRKAKEELRTTHEALRKAFDKLQRAQETAIAAEKLAAIGRLTAGVSHEILNPLSIITMRLQLMLSNPDISPEDARYLRTLEEQAHHIAKISDDLLYFARKRPPERRWLNFNETVRRTLGLLEYGLRKGNISVDFKLAEGLPPVSADEDQLQQVVLNLLTNAQDAMPDGGQIPLSTSKVRAEEASFVKLRAEDTGEGIDPKHMDKLYDPFFTTKPEGKGTGLGLSTCQGIIEEHGGSIMVESEKGRGTAVTIGLPDRRTPPLVLWTQSPPKHSCQLPRPPRLPSRMLNHQLCYPK